MNQAILSGIAVGAIYVLMSLGFALELEIADIVNAAHGAFVVGSMYLMLELVRAGVPIYPAVVLTSIGAGVISYPVYRLVIEPARRESGHRMQLVVTLLLLSGLSVVYQLVFGADVQALPNRSTSVALFGGALTVAQLVGIALAVVMSVLLWSIARYTTAGKLAYVASRYPIGARSIGTPVSKIYTAVFVIAGMLGGLAGGIVLTFQSVEPTQGLDFIIVIFLVSLIARTNLLACLVLGLVYGVVQAVLAFKLDSDISGTVTLAVLLFALIVPRIISVSTEAARRRHPQDVTRPRTPSAPADRVSAVPEEVNR